MRQIDVAVIGGGASGLTAAIAATRRGAKTVIIEHMDRVGKKLLATGNGKCNYTNEAQGIPYYRGENPAFVMSVFRQFGFSDTVAFFREMGIEPKVKNGYYYPASGQASSVLDVLRMEAAFWDVEIWTSCELKELHRQDGCFVLLTSREVLEAKSVVFATGLLAAPKTGSDGSALPYIEKLGHRVIDIVPALVQLQGKQSFFKTLAGIRAEISIKIYIEGIEAGRENGELQLTDFGISGIPVFQLSRFATRALKQKKEVWAVLDFLPQLHAKEAQQLLERRFYEYAHGKRAGEAMIGLFHKKLSEVLLKEAGIDLQLPAECVSARQLRRLSEQIKRFRVDIIGSKGFSQAQVCAGGVDTGEIEGESMMSKLVPGVFFAGEVVDIDGACGGYNLQWAWSSGQVAGSHAAAYALEL